MYMVSRLIVRAGSHITKASPKKSAITLCKLYTVKRFNFSSTTSGPLLSLQNKVAVITGAGSGIGRETAKLFNKQNAKIIGIDTNLDALKSLELDVENKDNIEIIQADVSNPGNVNKYMTNIYNKYKRIDILCNIAGILSSIQTSLHEKDMNEFQKVINVNTMGSVYNCKYGIKYMLESIKSGQTKGGSIINTSSIAAHAAGSGYSAYAISKHAITGLTQSIVAEYSASGIRCNCIKPGAVMGPMLIDTVEQFENLHKEKGADPPKMVIPMQRAADPMEIAYLFLFLASDQSSYITGSVIPIDGGCGAVFYYTPNRFGGK